ncbi:RNA polymerase sigma factor [Neolewinella antarctica]|uniref:RNA polymerase sigma-70 factor (ECF subfamily) n=1 Tax=Neolewinella antarctica TaxID=442734 RepID=A0ABX0XGT0_9BACT|nr:sigma-70 family RNA polymerase sigma factor [Neolewinella antarctica]NJC28407.1 RNA polymerase sigma-70 factor (ECF subfamily) [Neolewinella antarctica]
MAKRRIDAALISACLANQQRAQRCLYDISLPTLRFLAHRYLLNEAETQDALQESYLSIFKNLAQFDPTRGSFRTWAGRITINTCLKRNRKQASITTEILDASLQKPCATAGPLSQLTDKELLNWVKRMPHPYYTVFNLHAVEGYRHQEIAEMIGITPALSRQRLTRARAWLKQEIQTEPEHPLRDWVRHRPNTMITPVIIALHVAIQTL